MNTRKSYEFKVSPEVIKLIALFDGKRTIEEITETYNINNQKVTNSEKVEQVCEFLKDLNVLIEVNKGDDFLFRNPLMDRYERQINYLAEFNTGKDSGLNAQDLIRNMHVLIFGVGAIGGNIALLLAMAGVEHFTIFDYKNIEKNDMCRHMYFRNEYIGLPKVEALEKEIKKINKKINIISINKPLTPNTDINDLVKKSTFVINTTDEPYIGYTSLKISRACIQTGIPHYIAGGFDIHLMSTGELIIPGKTPCVECYTKYFKTRLNNWKPENKKIIDSINEYGGLSSQSLFSASFAVTQILKFICNFEDISEILTRGELDFETYKIEYLDVNKDPNCPTCGGVINET